MNAMDNSQLLFFRTLLFPILYLLLLPNSFAVQVVSEKIIFLDENGTDYVRYDTTRTNHPAYEIWFNKVANKKPEQHLKDYLYIYPNEYKWDSVSYGDYDLMKIASGSYASLVQGKLLPNSELVVDNDGVYTYTNWNGEKRAEDGHYGIWNKPDDFSKLVYAWVLPKNFSVISYTSNRKGAWVNRNNTVTYYGDNVNDLVFTIKYQPRSNSMYRELSKELSKQSQVQLQQDAKGLKITLAATVLFSSGSSELSDNGKSLLGNLSKALSRRNDIDIIIEGHTDNVTIDGELSIKYRTNWELSAARSLGVLHYLSEKGLPESHLEAHAFGETRPVVSNNTEQGRARNRRIEILVRM